LWPEVVGSDAGLGVAVVTVVSDVDVGHGLVVVDLGAQLEEKNIGGK
jgi:hypothetical protein